MRDSKVEEEITISWSEIRDFIKKRFLMIALSGLVVMLAAFFYTELFVDETYNAEVSMYVRLMSMN